MDNISLTKWHKSGYYNTVKTLPLTGRIKDIVFQTAGNRITKTL